MQVLEKLVQEIQWAGSDQMIALGERSLAIGRDVNHGEIATGDELPRRIATKVGNKVNLVLYKTGDRVFPPAHLRSPWKTIPSLIKVCLRQVGHTKADREATIDPGCMTEEVLYCTLHILAVSIEIGSQAGSQGAVDISDLLAGSCEHHDGVAVVGIVWLSAQNDLVA